MLRNILKIGALSFNIVAVLALLLSASASYLSPEKYHFSSYLGMAFVPLLVVNVFFVLFWAVHLKWHFLLSFLCLLLLCNNIRTSVSIVKTENNKGVTGKDIRIMSYNIMLFNYYKKDSKALDYIVNSGADIICLQEFGWHKNEKDFISDKEIMAALKNYPYSHINITLDGNKATYGIATFSKYPIVEKESVAYESNFNSSIYSDIQVGDDMIRVFNNHLESNKLTKRDRDNLTEKMDSEVVSRMAEKLSVATVKRAKQAETVAEKIAGSPYKVIVCGDFNDIPVSYVYRTMSKGLSDSFVGSGSGLGITFSDKLYRFRIDYILMDKNLPYYGYYIDKVKYSDHYPVYCTATVLN
jgi:endonuclease/exonuclease/phosphatase family metal-dependent hydrolase